MDISEKTFEEAIERALAATGRGVVTGPGDVGSEPLTAYGEGAPGGYERRRPEEYDRTLCLIPRDPLDFVEVLPRLALRAVPLEGRRLTARKLTFAGA